MFRFREDVSVGNINLWLTAFLALIIYLDTKSKQYRREKGITFLVFSNAFYITSVRPRDGSNEIIRQRILQVKCQRICFSDVSKDFL
jgi:hypothetical protein